jgi:hypothetical protein
MARFSEVFRCTGEREKSIREDIAKALGLIAKEGSFPEIVDPVKLGIIFNKLKNKKADLTIFVVDRLKIGSAQPDGLTNSEFGVSVIDGVHYPTTFAHDLRERAR